MFYRHINLSLFETDAVLVKGLSNFTEDLCAAVAVILRISF